MIPKTLNPVWNEQFDLHTFHDQPKLLEIYLYDKDYHGRDDSLGKCFIDLDILTHEETHKIWKNLEDGEGSIFLIITISGTLGTSALSDLNSYDDSRFIVDIEKRRKNYVSIY